MIKKYGVSEAKKEIKNSIKVYMQKDKNGEYIIPENKKNPFYLVGAPGIGKTEMVNQIAEELGIGFISSSLTHHTRNSILGLPKLVENSSNRDGDAVTYTEYTVPDLLMQVDEQYKAGKKEGILLLDEFASMSESLVAPMLAFLQFKSIGKHFLPKGWIMILCSNPPEYNETARVFDAAVMDRVRVMNIETRLEDFLEYAKKTNMHKIVIAFLENYPQYFYVCDETQDEKQIVTSRGWENLSYCLNGYENMNEPISQELVYQFVKSEKIAFEFCNFYNMCKVGLNSDDLDKIFKGKGNYLERVIDFSYQEKWKVSMCLLQTLENRSRKCAEAINFLDYMEWFLKQIKNNYSLKNEHIFGGAGVEDEINSRVNCGIGYGIIDYKQKPEPDALELYALNEIISIINERKSKKDNPMVNNGYLVNKSLPNSEVIEICSNWIERYRTKVDKMMTEQNNEIDTVINFVSACDTKGMIMEPFLRNMNQSENVMCIMSKIKSDSYMRELNCIYGEEINVC